MSSKKYMPIVKQKNAVFFKIFFNLGVAFFLKYCILFVVMKDKIEKEYHVILKATGKTKDCNLSSDKSIACFFTSAPVGSEEFKKIRQEKIDFIGEQRIYHGWTGYTIERTEVKIRDEEVSPTSPAYVYWKTLPVFKEISI